MAALLGAGGDQTFFLELLEGRIDGAGAGLIALAEAPAEILHELVAVTGSFVEQGEDGEADFAESEEAGAAAIVDGTGQRG
jgi:hypothetical protein